MGGKGGCDLLGLVEAGLHKGHAALEEVPRHAVGSGVFLDGEARREHERLDVLERVERKEDALALVGDVQRAEGAQHVVLVVVVAELLCEALAHHAPRTLQLDGLRRVSPLALLCIRLRADAPEVDDEHAQDRAPVPREGLEYAQERLEGGLLVRVGVQELTRSPRERRLDSVAHHLRPLRRHDALALRERRSVVAGREPVEELLLRSISRGECEPIRQLLCVAAQGTRISSTPGAPLSRARDPQRTGDSCRSQLGRRGGARSALVADERCNLTRECGRHGVPLRAATTCRCPLAPPLQTSRRAGRARL